MIGTRLRALTRAIPSPSFTPVRRGLLQRQCACGGRPGPTGECEACRRKKLPRDAGNRAGSSANDSPSSISEVPPIVHEVLRSPGQPLDHATRAFMEPRFGHDFSKLRVHTDSVPGDLPRAVNGLAYTASRRPLGQAACDPERGVVLPLVRKEHCAGDCVAQHEDRHVADMSLCCERYGRCSHSASDVTGRNKCRDAWNTWWTRIDAWTECNAYETEHACLRDLLERNCAPGSGTGDDPCCRELQKEFLGVEGRIAEYCPKAMPFPCPFGEDGTIGRF